MSDYMFVKQISSLISRESHPVEVKETGEYNEIGIRSHGKGIFHKQAVLGKTLGDKRVFKVIPNCIVFNIVFAWEQALAITSDAEEGFVASHRFPMYSAKFEKADLRYLRYYFLTKRGKADLELASPGGAGRNKTLGQKEFEKLKIKVPDFACQKKIADILFVWDKSIEATERLLENSKKRKKALMQQLLTGKKRLPGFHEKWDFRKFDMLFEVVNDKSLQIKSSDYLSSGQYPIVDQGKELVSGFSNSLPYNNLPVIVFGDHTRCLKWVDFSFVPGADGTQILRGSKNLLTNFGFFMLEATPIPNLGYSRHMRELKELEFRVPLDLKEQEAISVILATETNLIKKLDFKIESLKSEKKALMQQLLTGKKRVKVEEAA